MTLAFIALLSFTHAGIGLNGLSSLERASVLKAIPIVEKKIINCPFLYENYPAVRKKMYKILKSKLTISSSRKDRFSATRTHRCGYINYSSYAPLIGKNEVFLTPLSLTSKGCLGHANVIFHELVHLAWMTGSEEKVEEIEMRCISTK